MLPLSYTWTASSAAAFVRCLWYPPSVWSSRIVSHSFQNLAGRYVARRLWSHPGSSSSGISEASFGPVSVASSLRYKSVRDD